LNNQQQQAHPLSDIAEQQCREIRQSLSDLDLQPTSVRRFDGDGFFGPPATPASIGYNGVTSLHAPDHTTQNPYTSMAYPGPSINSTSWKMWIAVSLWLAMLTLIIHGVPGYQHSPA